MVGGRGVCTGGVVAKSVPASVAKDAVGGSASRLQFATVRKSSKNIQNLLEILRKMSKIIREFSNNFLYKH